MDAAMDVERSVDVATYVDMVANMTRMDRDV